ncbi:MAG TPA: cysteine hydrolase [Prolixibacteraceae bacterium]|jgi:nicotinamidase-related amidase|nr:cysteine hydrolase [Prolixibacteraceae bacterium]
MKNQLLVLVDIQNDYFTGGKMELYHMEEASANAALLLSLFRERNWPLVHIQHISLKANASFFVSGSRGVEIHSSVLPLEGEHIVEKHFPNSFRQTNLLEILSAQNIDELVICGAMSHMCIDTTTRAACDLGYPVTLIHDACATRNLTFNNQVVEATDVQTAYMAALNGSFAKVISASEYVFSLNDYPE